MLCSNKTVQDSRLLKKNTYYPEETGTELDKIDASQGNASRTVGAVWRLTAVDMFKLDCRLAPTAGAWLINFPFPTALSPIIA